MNTTLSRSTAPAWRTVGTVTLTGRARLAVGDPCYGALDDVDALLEAGDWAWDIRAAAATAQTASPWEVRLRRLDQPYTDDWAWVDAYQELVDDPAPGAETVGHRGVDSGTVAWQISPVDRPAFGSANVDVLGTGVFDSGLGLCTYTAFGDGVYPVAVRTVDGHVVEVRACYATPDPAPLSAEEFTGLLPGAFAGSPVVAGPYQLRLHRERYALSNRTDESGRPVERSYDDVHAVCGVDADGHRVVLTDRDRDGRYAPEVVRRVAGLWARVPAEVRPVAADERVGAWQDRPEQAHASIVGYRTADVTVAVR